MLPQDDPLPALEAQMRDKMSALELAAKAVRHEAHRQTMVALSFGDGLRETEFRNKRERARRVLDALQQLEDGQ